MDASTLPPTVAPPLRAPILPSSGSCADRLRCPFHPHSPRVIVDAPHLGVPHAERPPSHHTHPPSLKLSHHPSPSPPFIALKPFTFPGPWQFLTRRGLMSASPAVITPNSVLSKEAFKGLRDFSALYSGDEEDDVGKEAVGEGSSGDKNNLAITNLGLLQPFVDSLFKRGITHIFLIQCR